MNCIKEKSFSVGVKPKKSPIWPQDSTLAPFPQFYSSKVQKSPTLDPNSGSDGKEVSRINGIDPVKLSEQVEKLAVGAEMSDEKVVAETLNAKIHRLIHQDAIVLFMKGTPAEPFCKFRSVFGILITSFLKYKFLQHFFAFTSVRHFSISGQITLSHISEFII